MLCSKAEEVHRMKLEVAIIERKEQLDDLIPFRVEKCIIELRNFLLCMDISDLFLKMHSI